MVESKTSICEKHGEVKFFKETNGYFRCGKCRSASVQKRRITIKEMAVEYKGGKCERCGYSTCIDALDFHHLDPKQKDFGISAKGFTRSWESVKNELDKCMMVCSNCHREIHHSLKFQLSTMVVQQTVNL